MKDPSRKNQELIEEISVLKKRIQKLEKSEAERKRAEEALRESHELFRTLNDKAPLGMSLIDIDGRYEYVNPAFVKIFGYSLSDISTGKQWFRMAYPDPEYRREVIASWKEDLNSYPELEIRPRIYEVRCKGSLKTILFRPVALPSGKQFIIYEDITERKQAEENLRESEVRWRLSIENMLEAYALHESIFDENGRMVDYRFLEFNPAAQKISNIAREDIVGKTAMELYPHILERGLMDRYADVMTTGVPAVITDFYYAGDNLDKALDIACFRIDDRHFVCVFRDITERKQSEEALRVSEERYRELSIIDGLTKLYNSRYFYHQLKIELERIDRYGPPLTLLLLDLDDFKRFNDTYGHVEGDKVLLRLGQVVKRCLRETDSAYRYGGEEFTILLPMTTGEDGAVTAERIRTEFKKEHFSPKPGQDVHLTISIGLGQYKTKEEMKAFVHRVDQLMYQGKNNGKDRVYSEA